MTNGRITCDEKLFFSQIHAYLSDEDCARIKEAVEFARQEHGDQRRRSGELFFTHPLTVACYLAEYHLDANALIAALLHDIAEDTKISLEEIAHRFGDEVAQLVNGVTKLKDVSLGVAQGKKLSPQELQAASLHKMFRTMILDVRVVIIKLFDRLHNMRTIKAMPPHKQEQKAQETLSVYAPLANRLGIWKVKNELEALSLEVLHPQAYQIVRQRLEEICREHKHFFTRVKKEIEACLLEAGIKVLEIRPSPENVYTVYQDLVRRGLSFHDVDKTLRLVILLEDWTTCYLSLGYLHQIWKPVPGTFDDYVAVPRDNLYRSLHTTVVHSNGQHLKVRFRTKAMDIVSEIGVLARWKFADTPLWSQEIEERINTFLENINENINIAPQDPSTGVRGVVEDVFRKQVRVYTPRGDVVELGQGATPLDFAYVIHTELGNQCTGAYVNGVLYPLNKPLRDGDQIRITRTKRAKPQRAWLDEDLGYMATTYARANARRWFRRLPEEQAIKEGRDLLTEELNMLGLPDFPHEQVATLFQYPTVTTLYYALGRAELLPTVVATRILQETWEQSPSKSLDNVVYTRSGEKLIITNAHGRNLRLCGSCNPRPRDAIIGFLRKDGGITVHKKGCPTLTKNRRNGRFVALNWGEATTREARLVTIQIDVHDRPGLLFEITQLMQDEQINISYICTPPIARKGETRIILQLEIISPRQLVRILHQTQALVNVRTVRCLPEGIPPATIPTPSP
ncbi:MAG: bifunctional (p)ppGpp synthetase/guanosine-3',5'-bis(diphosphate) 3'-pyrophosphohydrolase [Chloroflexi bacterium]|nr:MAG: bifunctional (p)ppGpp synthetase/guanosine-3',5'-bis(diphosphate) 3'-pyrophosphohydrolase [Chloroflexota bacterium]